MEHQLNQAHHQFSLLEQLPLGVCVLQSDLIVLYWNGCLEEWTKIKREDILGQSITLFFEHFQQPRYLNRLRSVFACGAPEIFSSQLHPHLFPAPIHQHDYRVQHTTVTAIPNQENNSECYALISVQDVTDLTFRVHEYQQMRDRAIAEAQERKKAQELAESANRVKDEFLAIVSHELRTPLNPILGWSQLISQGKLSEVNLNKGLEAIKRNANLQLQLIDDLLDVSRILRGKLNFNWEILELALIVNSALDTIQLTAETKSIAISFNTDDSNALVRGDPTRLQQVVWNLLANAIKFTPEGGQIDVNLSAIDSHIRLEVKDTGKGINAEFLPYVFESFRQADTSTTRKFGGLGLGLAICRHLVELHGGKIWAESQGEGQGATFGFELPILNTSDSEIPQQQSLNKTTVYDLSNLNILVVDDEPDTLEFLSFFLSEQGANIQAVKSVAEAIACFNSTIPDLIISDLGMPDRDGYNLIQYVRSLPPEKGRDIPAIALTAYATEKTRTQVLQAGYQIHLSKPTNTTKLLEAIGEINLKLEVNPKGYRFA
jgi:signal transduction histidine kinase/ActR/RegA family two-component response regulator